MKENLSFIFETDTRLPIFLFNALFNNDFFFILQFKQNNEQLVFENRVSDSGFYQCIAENPYGSQIATAQIRITLGSKGPEYYTTVLATNTQAIILIGKLFKLQFFYIEN